MARDHRKLRVFTQADELLVESYRISAGFPTSERFGAQSQLRHSAFSAASSIVEGCARKTTKEYVYFLNVAAGSASEARYIIDVSHRLGFVRKSEMNNLCERYTQLIGGLQSLMRSLDDQP